MPTDPTKEEPDYSGLTISATHLSTSTDTYLLSDIKSAHISDGSIYRMRLWIAIGLAVLLFPFFGHFLFWWTIIYGVAPLAFISLATTMIKLVASTSAGRITLTEGRWLCRWQTKSIKEERARMERILNEITRQQSISQ